MIVIKIIILAAAVSAFLLVLWAWADDAAAKLAAERKVKEYIEEQIALREEADHYHQLYVEAASERSRLQRQVARLRDDVNVARMSLLTQRRRAGEVADRLERSVKKEKP